MAWIYIMGCFSVLWIMLAGKCYHDTISVNIGNKMRKRPDGKLYIQSVIK